MNAPLHSASPHLLLSDDLERQVMHWLGAARTFRDAEEFASIEAWRSVEREIGSPLRKQMHRIVEELISLGEATAELIRRSRTQSSLTPRAVAGVQRFRRRYGQVDTTLDFLGDAVNSRTSPKIRGALGALDRMAKASMLPVLSEARIACPPVLVYQDKGTGASILRAGVRLWTPGAVMPVAAIKIVRHNLYRPTSLFHETGHQVAHLTGWAASVEAAIGRALASDPPLRRMWQPWASEIAADVYAFLHTGFASIAALYDVVGDARTILTWRLGDPHPIGWLRTLFGCAMSRIAFGERGPWNAMEAAMLAHFPASRADETLQPLLARSRAQITGIARACLDAPVPALGGRPMSAVLEPDRVSPRALAELERLGGAALWTSPAWRALEGIRLVALAGLREAETPSEASGWIERARGWLTAQPERA
ncbi:hypothetical protein CLG85_006930 [Yangia mangrovi]|uniref:Uncharacterized protein n=1 Tax=Alloyangia mangrovi TaxID=1779329 RepID=A0A2A3JX97_9RHOB|nr:hypothetical protein [Alloyangia mangrovi]MCT4370081.1 hypothetical protein [Alloyangia mangrovi]